VRRIVLNEVLDMRTAALLVALFAIVVGVVGLVSPDTLLAVRWYVGTPVGLSVIAALRVLIGILLVRVAPISRAPKVLRVVGVVVIVAGVATLFFGVERTRAVLDYEAALGPAFFRGAAVVLMTLGGLMAFALRPATRALP
jgi:hypothetical protein